LRYLGLGPIGPVELNRKVLVELGSICPQAGEDAVEAPTGKPSGLASVCNKAGRRRLWRGRGGATVLAQVVPLGRPDFVEGQVTDDCQCGGRRVVP
jgi:hypothetical protein